MCVLDMCVLYMCVGVSDVLCVIWCVCVCQCLCMYLLSPVYKWVVPLIITRDPHISLLNILNSNNFPSSHTLTPSHPHTHDRSCCCSRSPTR